MRKLILLLLTFASLHLAGAADLTFLHTRGQDIVNERGEKVTLRGLGLGNWLLPEGYMWKFGKNVDRPRRIEQLVSDLIGPEESTRFWQEFRAQYITEADIARMAELGYNSVRPALNARLFLSETTPPQYLDEGFTLLENLVSWCKRYHVYVIIDMHAAPGGQTGQNIDDSRDDQPLLFIDAKYQQQLLDLWKKIATRYANEPTVAGYDLLNEPLPERTGAAGKYKKELEPLYQRITRAIREVDSKHMVIVEGADWANEWSVFSQPFDRNQVYQFHYYCWDQPAQRKSIRQYLDYRARFDAPVWVGETGERDSRIYWATTEYFEANNIGWAFWPWKKLDADNAPCSIPLPKHWDLVAAYSRGGAKPAPDIAKPIFRELLQNLRLTNCVYHGEVVDAMFRRIPGRVQAENYGADGAEKSFHVLDASRKATLYRTEEPVEITLVDSGPRRQEFAIQLKSGEWTAYTVNVPQAGTYALSVRAKAGAAAGELRFSSGQQHCSCAVAGGEYRQMEVGKLDLQPGATRIVAAPAQGEVLVDWFELSGPGPKLEAKAGTAAGH